MSTAAGGATSGASLALEGVTRRFNAGAAAVDGVSLSAEPGELVALLGASGSGKTTTLRIAAGYESPDAGRVLLDGRDITSLPPERRGFGMVFQHYALFPHMSVEENVAFGLEARGVAKRERLARARTALAGVGLEGAGARPVQALSGGEQQRVALARALVVEPPVLLLDEPLSNLDPTLRTTMRGELRTLLHRRQLTALFVTHDQEDAFAVADRVALLAHGRLLQIGTPEDLYDRPASRAVAEFVGRAALLPAALEAGSNDRGKTTVAITVGDVTIRVSAVTALDQTRDGMLAVLRPEQLELSDDEGLNGAITERRFAGAMLLVTVALDQGPTMEVATTNRAAKIGDRVRVRVARPPVALVHAEP